MQPRFSFDRVLLIPILISVISVLGIVLILLTTYLGQVSIPATVLPSSFTAVGAETPDFSPSASPTEEDVTLTVTEMIPEAYTESPTETLPSTSIIITESPPTSSATYTPAYIEPLRAGKYDDTDPNIAYDPSWSMLKNPGTLNAYLRTIHASTDVGNEASFRFTGTRVQLGYQRGTNFGTVTVIIDDQQYSFHEQAFDLVWQSPTLSPGDHFVRIIHDSGESINLDYIVILD